MNMGKKNPIKKLAQKKQKKRWDFDFLVIVQWKIIDVLVGSVVWVAMFSLQIKLVLASRKKGWGRTHMVATAAGMK